MANVEGTITENITTTIALSQTVYDVEGKKVGTVDNLDRQTGYLMVLTNPFSENDLYIPFRLITNIDPRELFLSVSKDELQRDYAHPPARTTRVAEVDGHEIATTTEPSGYDSTPIVVEQARVDELKKRIAAGDRVFTSEMTELGTIKRYDPLTGWMEVEKGVLSQKREAMVPVTAVDYVNRDTHEVYLAVSEADLARMHHNDPADVVYVPAEIKERS